MMILEVKNRIGTTLAYSQGTQTVSLLYHNEYKSGDAIHLNCNASNKFVRIWFEDSMQPAVVFSPVGLLTYPIPTIDNRQNHSPKSFTGDVHLIRAQLIDLRDLTGVRCLSFNPYDGHDVMGYYPHAVANVETRGESVFFARNAIDGILENESHGKYPYQSWGINRDPKAELTLMFGRDVMISEICITLRCDFPHDSWWNLATLVFSNGVEKTFPLEKVRETQRFCIEGVVASSLTLKNLIKAEDGSPFPALTQLEIYGKEICYDK